MKKWFFPVAVSLCCSLSPLAVAADSPADVLVSWRNGSLTLSRDDFMAALVAMPEKARADVRGDIKKITKLLDDLKLFRTLAADAKAAGLDKDPLIQKQLQFAQEKALAQIYFDQADTKVVKPDFTKAAKERYDVNPAAFSVPEQVHAAHVLISTKTLSDEQAAKRAEEVRSKALAGTDFAALAKEYSEDPSARQNNGDLGFFGRGRMAKPFEEAAFALSKPGEISPVVKTQFGYHVIKLIEAQPRRQRSFDEIKSVLIEQEEGKFMQTVRVERIDEIRNDKTTTLNTAAIDALHVPLVKTPEKNAAR